MMKIKLKCKDSYIEVEQQISKEELGLAILDKSKKENSDKFIHDDVGSEEKNEIK